jgi:galactokinase
MKYTFKSPGRINLIGEHTDYNDGYVLPGAIDKYTYITFEESDHFEAYSTQFDQSLSFSLDEKKEEAEWVNYVKGAILYTAKYAKRKIKPWKIEISGDLPLGAGLSSSASLMVGIVYGLCKVENFEIPRRQIASIAHAAENEFMGVNCGIMDQYIVAMAKKDTFMFIDTLTKEIEYVPAKSFPKMFVIDSGVKHKLASGEYNKRRSECRQAEKITGTKLRLADLEYLKKNREKLGETLYKRAFHVVSENDRVLKSIEAIKRSDWEKLGLLLYASHESLRDFYEISTQEIDFIIEELRKIQSIYGARMIGGGFGGSILAISKKDSSEEITKIKTEYENNFGIKMKVYAVSLSDGVQKLTERE